MSVLRNMSKLASKDLLFGNVYLQSRTMAAGGGKKGKGAAAGKPKKVLDVETSFIVFSQLLQK